MIIIFSILITCFILAILWILHTISMLRLAIRGVVSKIDKNTVYFKDGRRKIFSKVPKELNTDRHYTIIYNGFDKIISIK